MKKLAVLAIVASIAGCASDSEKTEIISSSTEEVYQQEQLDTLAKLEESIVADESADQAKATEVIKKAAEESKTAKTNNDPIASSDAVVSKSGYSIQVLALSHNKGFETYINKLPSNHPVWTNKKQLNGVSWYTVLYGQFDSKAAAREALQALPNDVKKYGPFIRDLDEVKASPTPKLTRLN